MSAGPKKKKKSLSNQMYLGNVSRHVDTSNISVPNHVSSVKAGFYGYIWKCWYNI